jgi:Phosphatidylserine/phosphatidylglycerophosphate/cardiolipin synthases and related enzymes
VRVHVLLDWVGSAKMDESYLTEMKEAGVQIEKFHKPHWYNLARLNNRTHRKLLVVDGQVGFTGGVGIAPQWMGNAQDPDHWRDSHYLVRGPVVAQMQATFLDNWLKVTGKVLHGALYFPPIAPAVRKRRKCSPARHRAAARACNSCTTWPLRRPSAASTCRWRISCPMS